MTALKRVRVGLTGFVGAPGLATFYFLDTSTAIASLKTFWDTAIDLMPLGAQAQVASVGDVIEDTTGVITAAWAEAAVAPSISTSSALYASPSGMMIRWETSVVADGRRVRGKTFIVPTHQFTFAAGGHVAPGAITSLAAAGAALVTSEAGKFVVWHRPRLARVASLHHRAASAHPGASVLVTGTSVPDKTVVLRSRRD